MPKLIEYSITAMCVTGFLTIWFFSVFKEISTKRINLIDLENQMHLHEKLALEARGGPEAHSAEGMYRTSSMLYREAVKGYNDVLHKPMNRIPSVLMGFRTASETSKPLPMS